MGSTLSQRKYLPSCCTRVSPHQLTLGQSSHLGLWCGRQTAEHPDPRVSAHYLSTRGHQQQGKDTWIVRHVASGHGCGQRTSTWCTHSTSWGGWAAYIPGLCSWRKDHSSYSGGDPAYPSFEQPSSWPDRCKTTRWVVYLGSPPQNKLCRPIGLVPWRVTGRGWMKLNLACPKIIAVLLETLMAILHSLNHRWRLLRYDSR